MSKLASMADAIARSVPDGSSVALGLALEPLIPFAAGHEIIRQRRQNLNLIGPISDILFDQLIGAGCVDKISAGQPCDGTAPFLSQTLVISGPGGAGGATRAGVSKPTSTCRHISSARSIMAISSCFRAP